MTSLPEMEADVVGLHILTGYRALWFGSGTVFVSAAPRSRQAMVV